MKKFIFSILALSSLLLLTGCNIGNKVVCTGTSEEAGSKVELNIIAKLKEDKVKDVSATLKFDDKETATYFCSFLKLANNQLEGQKMEFTCNGKTIKIKNYLQLENPSEMSNLTKEEFIKTMESDDIKCR